MDIDKILVSNKISFGKNSYKYFIGYLDDYKIKLLHIMLPERSVHVKSYDGEIKWIKFSIEDDDILKSKNIFGTTSEIILK